MPGQYCFVCASNEGVFLDVTPDNRNTFGDQIETCLSSKINECIDLSSKICYKCAYELDQCAKFVQKYKKSHEISERKAATSKPCCFLCHELVDGNRIFDITEDNNVLFNPLQKIRSIFNDDVSKKNTRLKLICLSCRYNLDVLYDLRRVYQETIANLKALINEEIDYSNFPKVHTDVVNRKTTITTFPDITFYGTVNSDSDSNESTNMARRGKRRLKGHKAQLNAQIKWRNNKPKVRNCDKCRGAVAHGIDMYRFYHTGLTVCKNCWITVDPSSDKIRRSRQTQSYLAETKLCTVFLTDVLSQKSHRKKKMHEVEKNKNDVTSHESSQEEEKSAGSSSPSLASSKRNHIVNGKARRGRKRRINIVDRSKDIEHAPSKMTRLSKERANTNEVKSTKASVDAEQRSSTHLTQRRGRKRTIDDRSTDSDGSLDQRETRSSKLNDRVNKTNRKKQKFILEERPSYARLDSSDETSNEDGRSLRSKTKGATSLSTVHIKKEREERSTGSRTRSSSISSTEMTSMEFKSPKSLAQSDAKMEYACDKCDKKFDTKLSNAKHRLTHLKQAALKLEKLTVSSVKEKQETEVDSQDDDISKEATSRPDRTAGKHTDDPSEEIDVNVEDTDDEEIFSLSTGKNSMKKVENETGSEDGNVIDKPEDNAARSESRVEEESANDENIETNESEQCEKSTDMPDGTLEIEDDKDEKDEEKKDKHTEDKDETSVNRDSDESKDEDVQKTAVTIVEGEANVDEEKDKEIEDDEKVSSIEKEKVINDECNNDEEDLHEETTRDGETIRSPILSIHETSKDIEDHESCENNLENNCEDYKDGMVVEPDKDEIMDEPDKDDIMDEPDKDEIIMDEPDKDEIMDETEMPQCDLMDEFSKEDTKEPEEDFLEILPTDKTDTLNDQRDLDDAIVNEDKEFEIEELEKQQNRFDEENMEVEISADVDEPNSAKDTVKPDLSNGEKHDEIRDSDDDDVAFVPVNNDSIDDRAKCNNVTEETVSIDDLKEKRKLEEEIKELEQLVDDNAMNNKHSKIQENSTYVLDTSSADAANEILREVFELAAAEVQHREDSSNTKNSDDVTISETLENISREIRKSADMPSLDPISVMELDDDIILN
ncbi:uncharacterized protein LOC143907790 isoform X1 [Temnothorax americanus]|uniref:uncharacterized protein LOC143907790 isoform X1 n=1 Tax=Temnothorax americanus TaxID=1964332 RepID=UPI0040683C18